MLARCLAYVSLGLRTQGSNFTRGWWQVGARRQHAHGTTSREVVAQSDHRPEVHPTEATHCLLPTVAEIKGVDRPTTTMGHNLVRGQRELGAEHSSTGSNLCAC